MRIKSIIKDLLNKILKPYGSEIIASPLLYEWQRTPQTQPVYNELPLPEEAKNYLCPNNPKLMELKNKYGKFDNNVTTPLVWQDGYVRPEDILYFRGDNAYVWQLRGKNMNIMSYALTTFYVKSIDRLGLLEKLKEDNLFGNFTFNIDSKIISRDLLDSIIEMYFLEKHLNIFSAKDLNILDIGSGYGRLAHRMTTALPNIQNYFCTDAVAVSTFICDFYIRFRKSTIKAKVIPLTDIENTLTNKSVDLALTINCFTECKISAINWWVNLLKKNNVKYLLIIDDEPLCTQDGNDIVNTVENHGYKLTVKEPKYSDPVIQQFGINPEYYFLFKLH